MLNLMIIHLVGLLSPGPDFFYVSRISAMSSRQEAIGGVIGITIGVLIWATAAVLGLAIIFATMPIIQQILTALAVITVETFLYFYIISVLFSRSVAKQFYSQYSRYIDNAAGLIFIFFGIYLIYSGVQHALI